VNPLAPFTGLFPQPSPEVKKELDASDVFSPSLYEDAKD
jgi:hypothetical protein